MFDDVEIRWHFPEEVELDPREPVIIQKLVAGTSEFVKCGVAPDGVRDMDSIRAHVRSLALAQHGEAWRAVTQRGELLYVYSVLRGHEWGFRSAEGTLLADMVGSAQPDGSEIVMKPPLKRLAAQN